MPQVQTHLVNRCRLELDFADRRDAEPMSAALMAAFKDQIALVMEEVCEAFVPPDTYITFDELDLDLGEIDPNHPIDDLVVKFRESLELRLAELLGQQPQSSPEQRAKSLVDDYLLTGQYPWWAGTPAPERLQEAMVTLLRHPGGGEWLARRLRQGGNPVARLVTGLPPNLVIQAWECLVAKMPPYPAQATIEAATRRAFMAQRVSRSEWTGFAERAIQFNLNHSPSSGRWGNFAEQIASATKVWEASSQPNLQDGFEALLWWMLDVAEVPTEVLAEVTIASLTRGNAGKGREGKTPSSEKRSGNPGYQSQQTALGQWWSKNWGWTSEQAKDLEEGLRINWEISPSRKSSSGIAENGFKVANVSNPDSKEHSSRSQQKQGAQLKGSEESISQEEENPNNYAAHSPSVLQAILPWLRRIMRQPKAGFLALITELTRVFQEESGATTIEIDALNAWMEARLPLQPAARTSLAEVMFRHHQRSEALAQEANEEEAIQVEDQTQVPEENPNSNLDSSVELNIAQPSVQRLFSPLLEHLYGLQKALNLPYAGLPVILGALLDKVMTSETEVNMDIEGIANWLQQRYPLAATVRSALANELLHLAMEKIKAASAAASTKVEGIGYESQKSTENPESPSPKTGKSGTSIEEQTAANEEQSAEPSNALQQVKIHLAWLQRTVGNSGSSLGELLSGLWEMYAKDTDSAEANSESIMNWLRQNYPLQPAARQVIAEALIANRRTSLQIPEAESKEKSSAANSVEQLAEQPNEVQPIKAEPKAPKPKLPTQTAISWLRKQLRKSDAGFATLIAHLLTQYQKEYPGAATNLLALETWIKGVHHPPKQHVPILAQALVDAIETQPRPQPKPSAKAELEKSIWIDNAGLILFSPFLQRYLQYAGLVEDKAWLSENARHHGVRLLQSMVDPSGEWNEASLALPKLLCGLQPDAIVDPYVPLPEELRGQDAALIEVALSHWTAAGKIGVEGFRAAWLARNASLRIRDDHWLLRVEAMGHDMLLEMLPWDIAYISLPWMPAMIYVDWGEKAKFNAI